MKVDNFDKIKDYLFFKEDVGPERADDLFYMVQIMTRSKDTGEKPRHIRTMFVESREYLMSHKDMIVKLCEMFNARAYISVNPSSYKRCAIKMFKELADVVENENYKAILSLPETLAGKYNTDWGGKLWIVDLDEIKSEEECEPYIKFIEGEFEKGKGADEWFVKPLPTVNGYHLLVSPFDVRDFKKKWPNIDIHKNNPTILYYGG